MILTLLPKALDAMIGAVICMWDIILITTNLSALKSKIQRS